MRRCFALLFSGLLLCASIAVALAQDASSSSPDAAPDKPILISAPVRHPPSTDLTSSAASCALSSLQLRYRHLDTDELRELNLTDLSTDSTGQRFNYDAAALADQPSPLHLQMSARLPSADSRLLTQMNTYTPQSWNGGGADGMDVTANFTAWTDVKKCWRLSLTAMPLADSSSACEPTSVVIQCAEAAAAAAAAESELQEPQSASSNECPNGDHVQCLMDPCSTAKCASGVCRSSYCGGCHATCMCRNSAQCGVEEECVFAKPQQPHDASRWNNHPWVRPGLQLAAQLNHTELDSSNSSAASNTTAVEQPSVTNATSTNTDVDSSNAAQSTNTASAETLPLILGVCKQIPVDDSCATMLCVAPSQCVSGRCEAVSVGSADPTDAPTDVSSAGGDDADQSHYDNSFPCPINRRFHRPSGRCQPDKQPQYDRCAYVRCDDKHECRYGECLPVRCSDNKDCNAAMYCGADYECRARGYCHTPSDCANDPSFYHTMCTGSYHCYDNKCSHKCGSGSAA